VLPEAHYLEAWGDGRTWRGAASVTQPLVLPLFERRDEQQRYRTRVLSRLELLGLLLHEGGDGLELVRRTFADLGGPTAKDWRRALAEGYVPGTEYSTGESVPASTQSPPLASAAGDDWQYVALPDYKLHDGRFADNGWLQELPDPVTKLTWDNAACLSPADAKELGVSLGDVVTVTVGETSVDLPVFILPGQARRTVAMRLGYGQSETGYIGKDVGVDVYPIVRAGGATGVAKVAPAPKKYELVTTQDHFALVSADQSRRPVSAATIISNPSSPVYPVRAKTAGCPQRIASPWQ